MIKIMGVAAATAILGFSACSNERKINKVSQEAGPLIPALASPSTAFTFAQIKGPDGAIKTLLVTAFGRDEVQAVDLSALGAPVDADVFEVLSAVGGARIARAVAGGDDSETYQVGELLPAAGRGARHVATGTNFREHAKEAEIQEVFNFPKFGRATPARTTVALRPGELLDYEVEICARFDRDIHTVEDFDEARKGFFLCGDFTDRTRLMRLVNPKNVSSGQGFTDAKSGSDFFPTGPFLVVPRDWKAFVRAERMTTQVNGQVRQDARGGEMILDFRAIVQKALTNGGGGTYTYEGGSIPLLKDDVIVRGSAVMSGTSEGVIFMPPRARDFIVGGATYIFTGPMFRGESAQKTMIERFIRKERAGGRYLRAGDVVTHTSSSMGDVRVQVRPVKSIAVRPKRWWKVG